MSYEIDFPKPVVFPAFLHLTTALFLGIYRSEININENGARALLLHLT